MPRTKIVLIGAGSLFGPRLLGDAMQTPELYGSEIVLVDIDPVALDRTYDFACAVNEISGAKYRISKFTDRREALPQASYIMNSFAIGRDALWQKDFEIPLRHGIKQVLGENGGPGGLSHTLRNVPIVLDICRDIEQLCPDALLLNFTNPESRMCMAIAQHSRVKAIGLCHGFGMIRRRLAEILDCSPDDIETEAGGLNHFTWVYRMWDKNSGVDLYPALKSAYAGGMAGKIPMSLYLMERFGMLPSPSDDHVGEYLSYGWEFAGLEGYDFDGWHKERQDIYKKLNRIILRDETPDEFLTEHSGEVAFDIIAGLEADVSCQLPAVNIMNKGTIPNLPDDAIVEVPATVDGNGVHPTELPALPEGVSAMCHQQIAIQRLSVSAAVTGNRQQALEAMLLDPIIDNAKAAEAVLNELLEIHKEYLPSFDQTESSQSQ
jgi:alpha-galactosidase